MFRVPACILAIAASLTLASCASSPEEDACQGFADLERSTDNWSQDTTYAEYAQLRADLLGVDDELAESGRAFLDTLRTIERVSDDDFSTAMELAPVMAEATIGVSAACAERGITLNLAER